MKEGTKLILLTPGSPEPGIEETTNTYRINGNYYQIQENFLKRYQWKKGNTRYFLLTKRNIIQLPRSFFIQRAE